MPGLDSDGRLTSFGAEDSIDWIRIDPLRRQKHLPRLDIRPHNAAHQHPKAHGCLSCEYDVPDLAIDCSPTSRHRRTANQMSYTYFPENGVAFGENLSSEGGRVNYRFASLPTAAQSPRNITRMGDAKSHPRALHCRARPRDVPCCASALRTFGSMQPTDNLDFPLHKSAGESRNSAALPQPSTGTLLAAVIHPARICSLPLNPERSIHVHGL